MSRHSASLPPDYFEQRYARDPDPWRFATSEYERAKYADTLAELPHPQYESALEIGCSIGVLTRALSDRCDTVLSLDVAEAALDQARERCRDLPHVTFLRARVPAEWPAGSFDLVLLSEVVYYLDTSDVAALADRVRQSLRASGGVILVHWTGETDYPLTGNEAAEHFIARAADFTRVVRQTSTDHYRLDVLLRR